MAMAVRTCLRLFLVVSAGAGVTIGCDAGGSGGASSGDEGPTVSIPAQQVVSGFARGTQRKTVELGAFDIGRHPVTRAEFQGCVKAGVCPVPPENACADLATESVTHRPNFAMTDVPDDVPVTCVGVEGAKAYCGWIGGRLPTLDEWFLAARGGSPAIYSWGSTAPSCDRHGAAPAPGVDSCAATGTPIGRVALHQPGASPFGLEDVLLTRSELLATSPDSLFGACAAPAGTTGDKAACVVHGITPAAIEAVQRVEQDQPDAMPYGFRCASGGAS